MPPRLNIPPITRAALVLLLAQSILSGIIRYRQWTSSSDVLVVPFLTLVPSMSLVYPWTIFTTSFVESNVFTLAMAGMTLWHGGKYLERAWTSREFAKFMVIVTVLPNALCFAVLVTLFALTGDVMWTLTPIAGTTSIQIAFLIAFSQLLPTHTVTLFRGIVSLRVPRFPLIFLLAVVVMSVVRIYSIAHVLLALYGFATSWTYLRFFKPAFPDLDANQSATLRGDASETFALSEFFPEALRPFVSSISSHIFDILVTLRLCTPFSQADVQASRGETSYMSRNTAGTSRAETERRRALALKALDQRLHAATAAQASAARTPQPPSTVQGDVNAQPKVTQAAMATPGSSMLGETTYNPEGDKGGNHA